MRLPSVVCSCILMFLKMNMRINVNETVSFLVVVAKATRNLCSVYTVLSCSTSCLT